MKNQIIKTIATTLVLTAMSGIGGDFFRDRGGIAMRGGYWSMKGNDMAILVKNDGIFNSHVEVGGFSGSLSFLSGIGGKGAISFTLGSVAKVNVKEEGLFNDYVDVNVATPILVGYQYALFANRNMSAFQPYVTCGGGPYVLSHIVTISESCCSDDDVTVTNKIRPGIFVGAGGYYLLSNWFAVHSDMRYHLVNLTPENDFSGFEVSVGLAFFWKR